MCKTILYSGFSFLCEYQELYRIFMDDLVTSYSQGLDPKDIVSKDESVSRGRKGRGST